MEAVNKFTKFKEALFNLPPQAHAKAVYVGQCWAVAGLTLGTVFLWVNGFWYFSVFMTAIIFLQSLQLISARQKYKHLTEMFQPEVIDDGRRRNK